MYRVIFCQGGLGEHPTALQDPPLTPISLELKLSSFNELTETNAGTYLTKNKYVTTHQKNGFKKKAKVDIFN